MKSRAQLSKAISDLVVD